MLHASSLSDYSGARPHRLRITSILCPRGNSLERHYVFPFPGGASAQATNITGCQSFSEMMIVQRGKRRNPGRMRGACIRKPGG